MPDWGEEEEEKGRTLSGNLMVDCHFSYKIRTTTKYRLKFETHFRLLSDTLAILESTICGVC